MKTKNTLRGIAIAVSLACVAQAAVVYETGYTAAQAYNDGLPLAGADQGWRWFGSGGPNFMVDTTSNGGSGFVTQTAGAWTSIGMAQESAFGSSPLNGIGQPGTYSVGDTMKITYDYQFSFSSAPAGTPGVAKVGLDSNLNDWNAAPEQGFIITYIDPASAGNTSGSINFSGTASYGATLSLPANLLGFDAGAADLSTDNMRIQWEITNTGGGNWDVTAFSVDNLDAATSYAYTGPTASFAYNTDAFFSMTMTYNALGTQTSVNELMKFEYTPIPEPATLSLIGIAGIAIYIRHKMMI